MPLYEYQCDSCGVRFERIQKFSDPLVTVCPTCGGSVQKLISSPAIQFKGSGWYITDYARKNDVPASKTGSSESKDSGESKDIKESRDSKDSTASKSGETSSSSDTKPAASPAPASTPAKN